MQPCRSVGTTRRRALLLVLLWARGRASERVWKAWNVEEVCVRSSFPSVSVVSWSKKLLSHLTHRMAPQALHAVAYLTCACAGESHQPLQPAEDGLLIHIRHSPWKKSTMTESCLSRYSFQTIAAATTSGSCCSASSRAGEVSTGGGGRRTRFKSSCKPSRRLRRHSCASR